MDSFVEFFATAVGQGLLALASFGITTLGGLAYTTRSSWYPPIARGIGLQKVVTIPDATILDWALYPGTKKPSSGPYYLYEARVRVSLQNNSSGMVSIMPKDISLWVDAPRQPRLDLHPPENAGSIDMEARGTQNDRKERTLTFTTSKIEGDYERASLYPAASSSLRGKVNFKLVHLAHSGTHKLFKGILNLPALS